MPLSLSEKRVETGECLHSSVDSMLFKPLTTPVDSMKTIFYFFFLRAGKISQWLRILVSIAKDPYREAHIAL